MSQNGFVAARESEWSRLDDVLDALERQGSAAHAEELPRLLRHVSEDLALAQHRRYASGLVRRLNAMALRAHTTLYRARAGAWSRLAAYLRADFPRAVRADGGLLVLGTLLLFGIGLATAVVVQWWPEVAYAIVGAEDLQALEQMHGASGAHGFVERIPAFGGYVEHNISIAFWTYAFGMLLGIGTLVLLVYNALVLGAVFGHLHRIGLGQALESFAIAHGAFELTGIMLAGVAGLKLGTALLAPGPYPRAEALRRAARAGLPILSGATAFLVVAAAIEAFWSPTALGPAVKFAVGGACWAAVLAYLALAGRRVR